MLSKLPGFSGLGDKDEEGSDGEVETLNATFIVLHITEDSGE
jgi:hypothetical protein